MAGENVVYSIGINLSALKDAQKMSERIKQNINSDKGKKGGIFGDTDKTTKDLKAQNKELGIAVSKLNIIRLTSAKIGGFLKGMTKFAIGGTIAGVAGGVASMKGVLADDLKARQIGLTYGQGQALGFADKMIGLNPGTLINSVDGLVNSLNDITKTGSFASLGLNPNDLKGKNPTDALFEVLDAMKDSNLPQYLKKEIIDEIGIPFDDFRFVLKEGTGEIRKFYKEGLGIFGNNSSVLKEGERAFIRFGAVMKDIGQQLGIKLVGPVTMAFKAMTPVLRTLTDMLASLISKIFTPSNMAILDKFIKDLVKWFRQLVDWLKPIIANIIKGFGKLIEATKPLITKTIDGLKKAFDFLKPAIDTLLSELLELWETLKPDLIKFCKWFKKEILPVIMMIAKNLIYFMSNLVDNIRVLWIIIRPIMKPLGQAIKGLLLIINEVIKIGSKLNLGNMFDKMKVDPSKLLKPLESVGDVFISLGKRAKGFWDDFVGGAKGVWTRLSEGLNNLWDTVKNGFYAIVNGVINIINGMTSTINKIPGVNIGSIPNLGQEKQINDGVITKDGQVIKTHPDDYIFAMKHPETLGATTGGGTYNININATVRNDNDVQKIKNELNKLLKSFNAKR